MRIGNYNLMSNWDNMNNLVKIMTKDKQFMQQMDRMPIYTPISHTHTTKNNNVSFITKAKNYINNLFTKKA